MESYAERIGFKSLCFKMLFGQSLIFLNKASFNLILFLLVCFLLRFAELFESIYLCNTHYVQKIKQLATSFLDFKIHSVGKRLRTIKNRQVIHDPFLSCWPAHLQQQQHSTSLSLHLYMTLCNLVMSQIVVRLLVAVDLWKYSVLGWKVTRDLLRMERDFFVPAISLHTVYF